MSIKLFSSTGTPIPHEKFNFPGGEVHVKVTPFLSGFTADDNELKIVANFTSSDDIMELALLVDVIRSLCTEPQLTLVIEYLAYSRQDRRTGAGQPASLKVFSKMINDMKFTKVLIVDPHSDVAEALLDNSIVIDQYLPFLATFAQFVHPKDAEDWVLVSPDSGATKKTYDIAKSFGLNSLVIQGLKHRNTATGKITGTSVSYDTSVDYTQKKLVVIDDICDGGRTFIELGHKLQVVGAKEIWLYVTHGIFSSEENLNSLVDIYDKVLCFNNMSKDTRVISSPISTLFMLDQIAEMVSWVVSSIKE